MSGFVAIVDPSKRLLAEASVARMLGALAARGDRSEVKRDGECVLAVTRFDWELAEGFSGPALVVDTAITVLGPSVQIIGPSSGALREVTAARNLVYLCEGFADRATRPDGSLVPRSEPGALITNPALCAARARELCAAGEIDTICVHGDTPDSVAIATAVRSVLDELQDPRRG